jgi:serpin B
MLELEQVAADAAFGTDLYLKLAGPGNLVLSPASIAAALRMALAGACGETAAEIARVLHLPQAGPEAARAGLDQLAGIGPYPGLDTGTLTLRSVNTAWLESALSVRKEFLDQPAAVRRTGFERDPEAARHEINAAVAEQTAGKIADLIGPGMIDTLTRLVLVNAIYLKSRWRHEFPPEQTRKEPFQPERSGPTHVDMMHLQAQLAYCRGDGYQAVLLPYEGGPVAMAIVVPDGTLMSFTGLLPGLGGLSGVLRGLLANRQEYQVDLRLPKFKVTSGFLLRDTLQALGIARAFGPEADFGGILERPLHAGDPPLRIDQVIHKALIDVDEHGTEAAAATALVMRAAGMFRPPAKRVTLRVDHPFLFAVVETTSGLPLFLGQLTRP